MPTLADYVTSTYLNFLPKEGSIGVEIEMELKGGDPALWQSEYWNLIHDGSLRLNGHEAVLKEPINIGDLEKALDDFQAAVKACKMKFVENSRRTSVHVHINVAEKRIIDVYNIISCYWIVEPLLVAFSGDHRRGNNFCLSATEAEGIVFDVCEGAKTSRHFDHVLGEDNRYGALNIAALGKFGSLEFRSMRGVYDKETLNTWISSIFDFCWKACGFHSPEDVVSFMSRAGEESFLDLLFSEKMVAELKKAYGRDWRDVMRDGALSVLELANSRESWELTDEEIKKANDDLKKSKNRPPKVVKQQALPAHERLIRRQIAMDWIQNHPQWDENLLDQAQAHFATWRWGIDGHPHWQSVY